MKRLLPPADAAEAALEISVSLYSWQYWALSVLFFQYLTIFSTTPGFLRFFFIFIFFFVQLKNADVKKNVPFGVGHFVLKGFVNV